MNSLMQDLRFAVRTLAKNPAFSLVAVLTLAMGIGANGAIFSLANSMLLKPLPGTDPHELVRVQRRNAQGGLSRAASYAAYRGLAAQPEFGNVSAISFVTVAWTQGNSAQELLAEAVSANYFDMLGIKAAQGRVFSPQQDGAAERTVVIGHAFWQNRLAGAASAVGQSLTLNGEVFTVVGIAPERFNGTQAGLVANLWVPLEQARGWVGAPGWTEDAGANRLEMFARRPAERTHAQMQAVADSVTQRLREAHPSLPQSYKLEVSAARLFEGQFRAGVTAFLSILLGIVGLVLLTASANLTNLLLVRMAGRRREIAVRMALGASRARLLQQLMCESVVVAAMAGALGVVVAGWAGQLLTQFNPLPATIPVTVDLTMDARVYFFIAALAAVTGLLLGVLPAWQASRPTAIAALKEEAARSTGVSGSRTRQAFVVAQVALSLTVLVVAGLFLRSMQNAASMELGFEPRGALALDIDVQSKRWSMERANEYFREIQRRVERLPGVESVAFMNLAPLDTATRRTAVAIAGHEPGEGREALQLSFNRVSPNYFAALRIPLRAGRDFTERDDAARPAVAVINETMARRYWPGESAVGKTFRVLAADGGAIEAAMASSVVEVIGVAADAKYRSLGETPEPHFYVPYLQSFDGSRSLLVRTTGDSGPMLGVVQRELVTYDATLPGFFGRTLEQHIALAYLPSRMAGIVSGAFALLGLALTAIGLYGVVAYSVLQRTRELGIRMALGASKAQVLQLVLGQGMRLVALGAAVGCAAALGLAGFVESFLYNVPTTDPVSYAASAAVLALFTLLASWLPARRATRVDPIIALRHE